MGASPEDVAEEMAELMEEFKDLNGSMLTIASYFHVKRGGSRVPSPSNTDLYLLILPDPGKEFIHNCLPLRHVFTDEGFIVIVNGLYSDIECLQKFRLEKSYR